MFHIMNLQAFKNFNNDKVKYINNTKNNMKADLIIIHTEWNEFKQLNLKKLVIRKF